MFKLQNLLDLGCTKSMWPVLERSSNDGCNAFFIQGLLSRPLLEWLGRRSGGRLKSNTNKLT